MENKAKIQVTGLPEGSELLSVTYRNVETGEVVTVPFVQNLEMYLTSLTSRKQARAHATGLLSEAVRLLANTTMSKNSIYIFLKVEEKVGWTSRHFSRMLNAELQKKPGE